MEQTGLDLPPVPLTVSWEEEEALLEQSGDSEEYQVGSGTSRVNSPEPTEQVQTPAKNVGISRGTSAAGITGDAPLLVQGGAQGGASNAPDEADDNEMDIAPANQGVKNPSSNLSLKIQLSWRLRQLERLASREVLKPNRPGNSLSWEYPSA